MPQIQVNGELVDISQEQYEALGQGTQATTTATSASSFEQYALIQAKIDGVKQLAAADAAVVDATNISPEFKAELDQLQAQADALAGDNLAQFQAQYQNESVALQAQGATNLDALRQELLEDPQPAIIEPGSVPVTTETIGIGGEEITSLNTTNNSPQQEPAVTNESFDSGIEPVNPTVDPQVNLPADISGAPDPTVAAYFQNKAELEAFQFVTAVEEGDRPTFVANPEERAAFIARLEANNQRLEAELEQKGLLSAVQQAEEQDRVENAAAQPPIGSLAELYPDDEPTVVSVAEIETEAATELTAEQTSADAEVSAFEEQQTQAQVPASEIETEATTELTEEQTAADPEVTEPALEEVPAAEIDTGPAPLTDEEIAEYQAQTATQVNETGANFQAPFVSDEAAAAEAVFFQENPEAVRAVIDAPPPPTVESETEELDLSLEEAEERAAAFEDTTELTEEEEAADPEITAVESGIPLGEIDSEPLTVSQDDPQAFREGEFTLSAADIDGGEDLDQDPGPGYGDVDEPLDPDILDRANEVEVDPYEDVLGRDLTEEEIAAEDNPVDYDLEEDIDPYNAIADRDLTEEEIQAEDNPIDYSNEVEVSPYEDVLGRDLTEEEIQAEDNPIDYDLENEIDPYDEVLGRDDAELTDEEIDAARADQQIVVGPDGLNTVSSAEAAQQQATLDRARQQATLQAQRKQANDGDWRVRLRLAPGAQYLYRAEQPGILQPLAVTDGVVFPYTPSIQTVYKANYSSYDLTHSNYRGYFYQGSAVEDIQITAKFTAQDSNEANYLLAVIHFFRSITKMFYGKDPQRGTPPPLVFLQGFGEYQFNLAPCVVAQFNYTLPDNVDYIRAGSPNINGTNLLQRRDRQNLPTDPFTSAYGRIQSVLKPQGIKKGAVTSPPAPPTLGTNRPTYVPTAMDISIILHPIQSRSQVSKQFSLQQYASGDLLKGGFW